VSSIPKHIPRNAVSVLHLFRRVLDLNATPKKLWLRGFAEYTSDPKERQRLLYLSSKQGSSEYLDLVSFSVSLLELLEMFPSCNPPLSLLLELLPALQPRYYSASCSPLTSPNQFEFTFTVATDRTRNGTIRKGICTAWLESVAEHFMFAEEGNFSSSSNYPYSTCSSSASNWCWCSEENSIFVPVFRRNTINFRMTEDLSRPLILIGAGTGVSPFKGFLEHHRHFLKLHSDPNSVDSACCWLFMGCRHEKRDFLFQEEFEKFLAEGTLTKLITAFSRDTERKIYVQNRIEEHAEMLGKLLWETNAIVYVCGEARQILEGVRTALANVLCRCGYCTSSEEAERTLQSWTRESRLCTDIWI